MDIGCGIGRHALALAGAGFSVTALDSSEVALEKLGETQGDLGIRLVRGDYLKRHFAGESFDIAISYNVLYHGKISDFRQAVHLIWEYLKPGGHFFLTCPTRTDGKYGDGAEVAPHTYRPMNSLHPGDTHYFASEKDLDELLTGFTIIDRDKEEHYWLNERSKQFSSYWHIHAQKQ